jgi:hypothetical protein
MIDFSQLNEYDLNNLKKVQSYCRRNYVINHFERIKQDYEKIFHEIEGQYDDNLTLIWPNKRLCCPKFLNKNELVIVKSKAKENNENKCEQQEEMNILKLENLEEMTNEELVGIRENVSLELMWIHQAIQSRIHVNSIKICFKTFFLFLNFCLFE